MRRNSAEEKITINAIMPISLEELAIYVLPRKRQASEIIDVLNKKPELANTEMEKLARNLIRKKKLKVKIEKLEHDYNDSENLSHGVAYFKVALEGSGKDLKRLIGENKPLMYDRQSQPESTAEISKY